MTVGGYWPTVFLHHWVSPLSCLRPHTRTQTMQTHTHTHIFVLNRNCSHTLSCTNTWLAWSLVKGTGAALGAKGWQSCGREKKKKGETWTESLLHQLHFLPISCQTFTCFLSLPPAILHSVPPSLFFLRLCLTRWLTQKMHTGVRKQPVSSGKHDPVKTSCRGVGGVVASFPSYSKLLWLAVIQRVLTDQPDHPLPLSCCWVPWPAIDHSLCGVASAVGTGDRSADWAC